MLKDHFGEWVDKNLSRFTERPKIVLNGRDSFRVVFENVPDVCVSFTGKGAIVWGGVGIKDNDVVYSENIDILIEFDIHSNGNWIQDVYEPLLTWVNSNISSEHSICFYESQDKEIFWVKILKTSEVELDKNLTLMVSCKKIIVVPMSL